MSIIKCETCPRHCELAEGQVGFCRAREVRDGLIKCKNYGIVSSYALDPIEKKPLYHFHPGSKILSVGSFGCNMNCFYCQNYEISQLELDQQDDRNYRAMTPVSIANDALDCTSKGNIGIAFTYNEPVVGWEFVCDTANEAKKRDLSTVMVTNGCFCENILEELMIFIDAFNIDLKCFDEEGYKRLGGDFETVKHTIERAATWRHVEVTSLIVPGQNDSPEKMEEQAIWLASISPDIPLHISKYFPRWKADMPETSLDLLYRLFDIAKKHLKYVHIGNV